MAIERHIMAAFVLSLGACATVPGDGGDGSTASSRAKGDPALMVECLLERDESRFIRVEAKRALPGATLGLSALQGAPYAGAEPSPKPCVRNWALSDGAPAVLAPDRSSLTIAAYALPGATFVVSAKIGGEAVSTEIVVADPAIAVIQLRAKQGSIEGCYRKPIGEIVLDEKRRFEVTFNPFERYVDYWGTYDYDTATGRLTMTVSGGNEVPAGLVLEGTATEIEGGGWRLDGFDFGGRFGPPREGESCTYVF